MGVRRQAGRLAAEQLLDALRAAGVFVAAWSKGREGVGRNGFVYGSPIHPATRVIIGRTFGRFLGETKVEYEPALASSPDSLSPSG